MMVDTSLDAYQKVKETLTKRQTEIYEIIQQHPNKTAAQYAQILVKPVNTVSGRFSELGAGTEKNPGINVIKRVEKIQCPVTKGMAWTLRVV